MRDIPVGNGSLLVNFDNKYQIRDIYFPHVGQENHTEGFPFRFGIWVDGDFSWVASDEWQRQLKYIPDSLITDVRLLNSRLGIEIGCRDMVAGGENIYLRRIVVTDLRNSGRNVRVFLHHDFRIYENEVGDTAFYDPDTLSLIHYKKHRYFLINTLPHFDEFATGRKAFRGQEGTWRDAEDGHLHGTAITEGSVDSTVGVHGFVTGVAAFELYYWIAAGSSHQKVASLNNTVLNTGPSGYFERSKKRWDHWLKKGTANLNSLPDSIRELYRRSLLIIRTQIDNEGAIIAANDHDVTERATDHYSYLWPRDGAFVANALDLAGYPEAPYRFFELCSRIVNKRGYFLQKYNPDGTVGSGWHAFWDSRRKCELFPIQQDETALVLWALWEHYSKYPNRGFIEDVYERLIENTADFLLTFRDDATGLPKPSWNLWEDRRGIHTFTCATVVAGLRAAARFANEFRAGEKAGNYSAAADEICVAMRELYSPEHGRVMRAMLADADDNLTPDPTVDASLFAIFYFGCFDVNDALVVSTMSAVEEHLLHTTAVGGVARFQNDGYMLLSDKVSGNSWPICTLWLAEYYIARATAIEQLKPALELLEWCTNVALPSGVLSEQIDPLTGTPLSVSPLTWSHSTFVATTHSYLAKLRELSPVR
ncbi:MAG: glycoside hydrolase family 15 protein [Acidobacteria bacterium]|nr:glycoside hydrolase family 15 protein [Acidobacteriota bacterium]